MLRVFLLWAWGAPFGCSDAVVSVPAGVYDPGHRRWDQLLTRYVEAGVVDYSGLREAGAGELDGYLGELVALPSTDTLPQDEALAFWINAYNAWTVKLIVDNPGVGGIREIRMFRSPWRLRFIPMSASGAAAMSLDEIEHEVIRTRFRDPRIHMALVCASVSCPPLRSEAYVGDRLDAQLDAQARQFLADPARNSADAQARVLRLSPIFGWYVDDFTESGGVGAFVQRYGPPELARGAAEGWQVAPTGYDWSLNGR